MSVTEEERQKTLAVLEPFLEDINQRFEKMNKKKVTTKFIQFETVKHGHYKWKKPKDVQQIFIDASGGGASGEGLLDYTPFSVEGKPTIITFLYESLEEGGVDERIKLDPIVLKGGIPNQIAPRDYVFNEFTGKIAGDGEDSPFARGGKEGSSEEGYTSDGAKGSGGCGVSESNYSTHGGGCGESKEWIEINEASIPDRIEVVIGKGGNPLSESFYEQAKNKLLREAGKGGDGYIRISYVYSTSEDNIPAEKGFLDINESEGEEEDENQLEGTT